MIEITSVAFDKAFKILIGHEGGFQNKWGDRGNWTGGIPGRGKRNGTKYGISAMSYPHEDIKGLSLARAQEIYWKDYWKKCGANEMDFVAGFQVFDLAVNSGVRRTAKMVQKTVGAKQDGIIGPKTRKLIKELEPAVFVTLLSAHRILFMTSLRGLWNTWGRGWMKRVANNMLLIKEKK